MRWWQLVVGKGGDKVAGKGGDDMGFPKYVEEGYMLYQVSHSRKDKYMCSNTQHIKLI